VDLATWIKDNKIDLKSQIIPIDTSLEFDDFETFIIERRKLLVKTVKDIIGDSQAKSHDKDNPTS
jgi:hypothetical protein